jgi:hypothetical protein
LRVHTRRAVSLPHQPRLLLRLCWSRRRGWQRRCRVW